MDHHRIAAMTKKVHSGRTHLLNFRPGSETSWQNHVNALRFEQHRQTERPSTPSCQEAPVVCCCKPPGRRTLT